MNRYIKESFQKFRTDLLSKVFYDASKALLIGLAIIIIGRLFPKGSKFGQVFQKQISVPIYGLLSIIFAAVFISVLVLWFLYRKRYQAFKNNMQTDELTNLKNYKALEEQLPATIKDAETSSFPFSIIMIDVDDFKNFNTTKGYNEADSVLKKLGELLLNDKRATDETFRKYSRGDEFVIIARKTTLSEAYKAAERKRALISETAFDTGADKYSLTVCCGITQYKPGDTMKSIIDRVNLALLEAKKQPGKNNSKSIV